MASPPHSALGRPCGPGIDGWETAPQVRVGEERASLGLQSLSALTPTLPSSSSPSLQQPAARWGAAQLSKPPAGRQPLRKSLQFVAPCRPARGPAPRVPEPAGLGEKQPEEGGVAEGKQASLLPPGDAAWSSPRPGPGRGGVAGAERAKVQTRGSVLVSGWVCTWFGAPGAQRGTR